MIHNSNKLYTIPFVYACASIPGIWNHIRVSSAHIVRDVYWITKRIGAVELGKVGFAHVNKVGTESPDHNLRCVRDEEGDEKSYKVPPQVVAHPGQPCRHTETAFRSFCTSKWLEGRLRAFVFCHKTLYAVSNDNLRCDRGMGGTKLNSVTSHHKLCT